jgi:hypothetical protein
MSATVEPVSLRAAAPSVSLREATTPDLDRATAATSELLLALGADLEDETCARHRAAWPPRWPSC